MQDWCSTGHELLDKALGGGYESEVVTTLYGPSGSGKTNLCMVALVATVLNGKKVVFIDPEGGFSITRLSQILPDFKKYLDQVLLLKPMNFEEQKKTLEQRKNIIEQLRKNQSLPVRILTEMSNVLASGIWLQSMSVSGESISISGAGFTNEDVVNYVDNLKKSKLFTDVNLIGTQKAGSGKVVTYQFTLTCRAKAS